MTAVIDEGSGSSNCTSMRNDPVLANEMCEADALKSGVKSIATNANPSG